jgi:hypothetical protein
MNEQQLAAVKLALGALEESVDLVQEDYENAKKLYGNYPTRQARLLGMEEGLKKHEEAITALQSIIDQDALYKMAEDAVTIGLSYNDWPKIGCVNHDCDKCKAVQEPVTVTYKEVADTMNALWGGTYVQKQIAQEMADRKLYTTPPAPQPVPVKTYHDGKPWPVAPKPWVDMSDEEIDALAELYGLDYMSYAPFVRALKQRLKEKNT